MKKILIFIFLIFPTLLFSSESHKAIALNSPRKTFKVFREYMDEASLGDYKNLLYVFKCTDPDIDLNNYKFSTDDLNDAIDLYLALLQIDYDIDDIPSAETGDKVTVKLKYENIYIDFHLIKSAQGNWMFSKQTIDSVEIRKLAKKRLQILSKYYFPEISKMTFIRHYRSAAETYSTFMNGMENKYGFDITDAIDALDLSNYPPIIRHTIGKYFAITLYRILKPENISVSTISADPDLMLPQILFIEPDVGSVVINCIVGNSTNTVSWKFTPQTLNLLPKLYRNYEKNTLTTSIKGMHNLTIAIAIDDWLYRNRPFFTTLYLNMELWKWIALAVIACISLLALYLMKFIFIPLENHLSKQFRKKDKMATHYCVLPLKLLILFYILWTTIAITAANPEVCIVLSYMLGFAFNIVLIWLGMGVVRITSEILIHRTVNSEIINKYSRILFIDVMSRIIQILILFAGIYYTAIELGFKNTHILTAFGIGSLALALAGKDTIENFFGTLMITIETPIRLNDWILIDDKEGVVEKIGLRSTRIRTFEDSVITMPNSKFITNSVNNMGMRVDRRYNTTIGIEYGTSSDQIQNFTSGIVKIIKNSKFTNKENYIIRTHEFGVHSIEILIYMFFNTPTWANELEAREAFILKVLDLAAELSIEIAYPTSTINIKKISKA